ncbi:MAG: type II toxin-antitoxin system VapB family antitoxin [Actinobacteria bacterium]|nr:type II toxin-antitoxin system VapB family antitoxin [Actinomycetota bacterium]
MTEKLIDIDEGALDRAREILGADTTEQTVNEALAEVVRLAKRQAHAARLADMGGLDVDDGDVMGDVWR